jgi:hypothetical protein
MPVSALDRSLLYLNSSFRVKGHGDVMEQLRERGHSSEKKKTSDPKEMRFSPHISDLELHFPEGGRNLSVQKRSESH